MENKDYTIKDREFMGILHEINPQGVEYANKAINKALELSEVSNNFYSGVLVGDYGIYPFLNASAAEYEENGRYDMHIVFRSALDKEMLEEWLSSLQLSNEEKQSMISDVRGYYKFSGGKLDMCYLDVMNYLIQMLKCFKERYETGKLS